MWINFIPLLFNGSNTIEYRIHPPTNNFNKILAWAYITNAILQYSEEVGVFFAKKGGTINAFLKSVSIKLDDIIDSVYPKSSYQHTLCTKYLKYRRKLRGKLDKNEDYIGLYEFKNDYEFIP